MTLGTKLEENPYTGLEYEPTVRLLYAPDNKHSLWGAISRAVCSPGRADEQGRLTFAVAPPELVGRIFGNDNVVSEDMWAYELGYREQTTDKFSWDIATYYNVYNHAVSLQFDPGGIFPEPNPPPFHLVLPTYLTNLDKGSTYGVELCGHYEVWKGWRLFAQYTVFEMNWAADQQEAFVSGPGYNPHNQVYVSSNWDLRENLEFDLMARYIDALTALAVPSYITMDARLAWRPRKCLELAVVGQNLLQNEHYEFGWNNGDPAYPTAVPRSMYATLTWRR